MDLTTSAQAHWGCDDTTTIVRQADEHSAQKHLEQAQRKVQGQAKQQEQQTEQGNIRRR
jgi:hypothetical protein